ncbi:MAG TPA: plastocyanin/azurin family copper-binding protein [Gaiellales bacterium]|nr:plastocyanin/azurin family copper-binding protein [Gaiellales bacterium]
MRSLRLAAAAAALTLALAACGSASSSGSSSAPTAAAGGGGGGTTSTPVVVSGKKIDVTEKDFSITVAGGSTVKPGTYTFVVVNKGPSSHDLTVNGPGVADKATPISGPGTQTLTVTLKKGTYDLFCSVPGHRALGMDTKLQVGSGGSGTAAASSTTSTSSGGGSTSSGGSWS